MVVIWTETYLSRIVTLEQTRVIIHFTKTSESPQID